MRALLSLPLLALACAKVTAPPAPAPLLPGYLSDPEHSPPPSCPGYSHLSAVGASSEGYGAALDQAKHNLLAKLGDGIRAEAESFAHLFSMDGSPSPEHLDLQRVLEEVDFAHPDLVEIAGPPQRWGKKIYVVACLARGPTIARLEGDVAREAVRFDTWDQAAQDAQSRADQPAFAAALSNLAGVMAATAPTLVQIRVLAGGPGRLERRLTARWLASVEAASKLRAQVPQQ